MAHPRANQIHDGELVGERGHITHREAPPLMVSQKYDPLSSEGYTHSLHCF